MASSLTAAGTQAVLAPAKMARSGIMSRPANTLIPFVRNSFLSPRTQHKFLAAQPMASSTAKEDTEVKVQKEGSENKGMMDHRRQPSLSLVDYWDPFSQLTTRSLRQMMRSMDRMLGMPLWDSMWETTPRQLQRMPWDIMEDEDNYHMRIDIPGFSKEEVNVRVEEGTLVVDAKRKSENVEEKDGRWERSGYGNFYTRVTLPENVESDKISAKLAHGVLEVSIPKSKAQHKQVMDVKIE